MGSGVEYNDPAKEGILPRAIMHIFQRCAALEKEAEGQNAVPSKCLVSCQFIEVKQSNVDEPNRRRLSFSSDL